MTREHKDNLLLQIVETIGGEFDDYRGLTLEDALCEVQDYGGGITVLWGCWTEKELQETL